MLLLEKISSTVWAWRRPKAVGDKRITQLSWCPGVVVNDMMIMDSLGWASESFDCLLYLGCAIVSGKA